MHLLNLTLRQEGVEEGGKTAKEEGRRERELGGEEREERRVARQKDKEGEGCKDKKGSICVCSLKLYARALCKEIHRIALKVRVCGCPFV